MITVNMHAAKTNLSKLVKKASEGEEVVLSKAGEPVARIIPYQSEALKQKNLKPRKPGALKGKIWIADNFDDPMELRYVTPQNKKETKGPRKPGALEGQGWIAENFDEPLEEFEAIYEGITD